MTDQAQTTTEPVLLPCPFCGNRPDTQSFWYGCAPGDEPRGYHVFCLECSDTDTLDGPRRDTLDEAIAAWNTRTTPQPLAIGLDGEAVARVLRGRIQIGGTDWDKSSYGADMNAEEVADAILALSAPAEGWQGIETAPKDGTGVIAFVPGFGMGSMVLSWFDGYWREPANHMGLKVSPTHWMPLPAAPTGGRS